jgi:hypothetical protein
MKEQNSNILEIMDLCKKLLICADKGDNIREDDCCGVLYAIARDCAYRILDEARKERSQHIRRGIWESDEK